jgi:hypothetical protein
MFTLSMSAANCNEEVFRIFAKRAGLNGDFVNWAADGEVRHALGAAG